MGSDDEDVSWLASTGLLSDAPGDSGQLGRLSRQLAGEHVEVLATFAAAVDHAPVAAASADLRRLAVEADDHELIDALDGIDVALALEGHAPVEVRRAAVLRIAALLGPSDAFQLRALVGAEAPDAAAAGADAAKAPEAPPSHQPTAPAEARSAPAESRSAAVAVLALLVLVGGGLAAWIYGGG